MIAIDRIELQRWGLASAAYLELTFEPGEDIESKYKALVIRARDHDVSKVNERRDHGCRDQASG